MTRLLTALFLSSSIAALSSCGNGSEAREGNTDKTSTDSIYPAVEKNKPNANYPPAFEGQTRIAGVKTTTPFEGKVIAKGLKSPWGIAVLPDGRFLVTEKEGDMRIVSSTGEISEGITGIPEVAASGQGGLLGLTLDPKFESNRMVYWVFSQPVDGGNLTAVAKGKLSADEKTIEGATVIYQAGPAHKGNLHFGGRITFDKNGHLFVSTGERSDKETRPLAQSLTAGLGKILRITTDGKAVEGNPFTGHADALPEIYSYGHRNVQGLAFHPETGDLWETEFGPRGGDELNRVEIGKNYGWPTITYGLEYSGKEIGTPPIQQQDGLEQPAYYWDPVLSPSGIAFYTGAAIPEWKNSLFITGLSSMHIARIVIKDNKVVGEERLLDREGERFRDIIQGNDDALYSITDGGKLYRIGSK
ncbi:PQQ-dependent sugar dehydrogenase [Sphingobacterium pedocola]|uniref:Glucose dehydrogenase n=1 Tax=Sphingobacterium pedocola TaxID=2082722 RepID=A0ABR9T5G6_9SPHI|nr:PQQ-dependent sugar dehydrogenase [Sphingobacterium pedocola]MBE8720588.1 glucose dehydrogenase [Sphingobacterium pedocola]